MRLFILYYYIFLYQIGLVIFNKVIIIVHYFVFLLVIDYWIVFADYLHLLLSLLAQNIFAILLRGLKCEYFF
jgi:hypothetical protein